MRLIVILTILVSTLGFAKGIQAAESDAPDVFPLDRVTISAEKKREMMARILRIGMSNIRSDKAADANKIVCVIRKQTGTHISDLECGSNAAFNYRRAVNFTMNSAVISQIAIAPAYTTSGGDVHGAPMNTGFANAFGKTASIVDNTTIMTYRGVSKGAVKNLINDYASGISDEQNRKLLKRDMIWSNFAAADGRHGFSADQYTAFVQAYKEVKALENSRFASEPARESAMATSIDKYGLSIDVYNEILDRVLQDDDLRVRVMNGLDVEI